MRHRFLIGLRGPTSPGGPVRLFALLLINLDCARRCDVCFLAATPDATAVPNWFRTTCICSHCFSLFDGFPCGSVCRARSTSAVEFGNFHTLSLSEHSWGHYHTMWLEGALTFDLIEPRPIELQRYRPMEYFKRIHISYLGLRACALGSFQDLRPTTAQAERTCSKTIWGLVLGTARWCGDLQLPANDPRQSYHRSVLPSALVHV